MTAYVAFENQLKVHQQWLDVALSLAEEALAANEVPVGCVFVRNGVQLAAARNRTNELRNATRHAELEAIDEMLSNERLASTFDDALPLKGVTLYVTVEPCIMCASALRQMGIEEVYCGCLNDRFGGCGGVLGVNDAISHPTLAPYKCYYGYRREESIMVLRRFYMTENTNAPVPRSKSRRVLKTEIQSISDV